MIHFDLSKSPAIVQCDETTLDLGPRLQIDAYTWLDEDGKRHIVLQPTAEEAAALPKTTQRGAFTLAWVLSRMSADLETDQ